MDYLNDLEYLRSVKQDFRDLRVFRCARRKRRKIYKPRFNPFDLTEDEFKLRYRFSKDNMQKIIDLIGSDLKVDTRGGGIPVELQVTAAMSYWGRNGNEVQEDCANIHGISQGTFSRLCRKVSMVLASKCPQFQWLINTGGNGGTHQASSGDNEMCKIMCITPLIHAKVI